MWKTKNKKGRTTRAPSYPLSLQPPPPLPLSPPPPPSLVIPFTADCLSIKQTRTEVGVWLFWALFKHHVSCVSSSWYRSAENVSSTWFPGVFLPASVANFLWTIFQVAWYRQQWPCRSRWPSEAHHQGFSGCSSFLPSSNFLWTIFQVAWYRQQWPCRSRWPSEAHHQGFSGCSSFLPSSIG